MVDGQDLMRQIARAGALMDPGLSDQDVDRLLAGATSRRRRRRRRQMVVTGAASIAVALAVAVWVQRRPDPFQAARPTAEAQRADKRPADPRIIRLIDGSTVVPLDPTTEIAVVADTSDHVSLQLTRGRGRFDVTPRPARTFVVHVGAVTISVLGTRFTIEQVADRVGLSVEHGTVRVEWGVGSTLLKEGDSGWYPPLVMGAEGGSAAARARSQALRRAPLLLASASEKTKEHETAKQLLAAADHARLFGHPEDGAMLLRKLLRDHRNDARAPLAAFTLGRMLLRELATPIEAAAVFAEARRLSPQGPLAEDALAREVEALHQAGAATLAKARAQEYLRLYPDGRRATVVRRMAEIQ